MKKSSFANIPFSSHCREVIAIERALSDMRRGVPVIITDNQGNALLVAAVEAIAQEEWHWLQQVAEGKMSLVLTEKRAEFLFPDASFSGHIQGMCAEWTLETLQELAGITQGTLHLAAQVLFFTKADALASRALDLVKLAELLPTVVILALAGDVASYAQENQLLRVSEEQILHYKDTLALTMKEVCRAPLRLENAGDAAIIAFRSAGSNREHYAIIVGNPDKENPLVRVHSSCYTGDLLGSLHCDCGDQLKTAISSMAEGEGGIVLYLMQEGRGIGLTNKLRTYALQATGIDTVDANEMLGFDDDERLFLPAAKMLHALAISRVRLLSNNPRKAKGLEECGITVSECVPHIMTSNKHNETYLKTKATRLGHNLPS